MLKCQRTGEEVDSEGQFASLASAWKASHAPWHSQPSRKIRSNTDSVQAAYHLADQFLAHIQKELPGVSSIGLQGSR